MSGAIGMTRRTRSVLGTVGGILWGAGIAVLVQQYGLWPLDAALAYGAPLAAAVFSGFWARGRAGRVAGASAALAVLLVPTMVGAFQSSTCDAFINGRPLAESSPTEPIPIDPDEGAIRVELEAAVEGVRGEVWIEFGGIRALQQSGEVNGGFSHEYDLRDNGIADLSGAPGLYHLGGSIEGTCTVDGYVDIAGNPLANPVGQGAAAAVVIGILITWIGGRPPRQPSRAPTPAPSRRRARLNPTGRPYEVGEVTMRSPGLEGEVEVHEPTEAVVGDVAGWTEDLREVFTRHHVEPERVIEITRAFERDRLATGRPSLDHLGRPALELELPHPGRGNAQILLSSDEAGLIGWHFPRIESGAVDILRAEDVLRYRLARRVAREEEPERRRGVVGAFGSKVVSSLVFPLLDPVFERVGERFAATWEAKRRPYRFRTFTPRNFDRERAGEPDWDHLARGPALLFVHGTFSRAHTGFGALPVELLADLHHAYDGRVFAFDHPTLSDDPRRNVAWFFDHVPDDIQLQLDIVCHSRGGLVSRVLAERQGELGVDQRGVAVDKIVFVGSPNAGTVLAEPAYVGDYIDSYTNLVNFVPSHQVVDVLEGVVTVVKHVAVGAMSGLNGLQAMRPGGEFLGWLNRPAANPSRYFAVAGDYEPAVAGWRHFAVNRLMDGVFRQANDLVVPTAGTFNGNGSNHFPIPTRLEFGAADGVDHSGYFATKRVGEQLLEWLTA